MIVLNLEFRKHLVAFQLNVISCFVFNLIHANTYLAYDEHLNLMTNDALLTTPVLATPALRIEELIHSGNQILQILLKYPKGNCYHGRKDLITHIVIISTFSTI